MLEQIFEVFGLSVKETKIYLCLLEQGAKPAGLLAKDLNIPRATLYGHLDKLKHAGFVTDISSEGVRAFSPEHPEKLNLLYKQKLDRMHATQQHFEREIPALMAQADSKNIRPRLQYFENKHALHAMMNDMLMHSDIQVYSFYPAHSMIEIMGEEYLTHLNLARIKQNIRLKAIWPPAQVVDVKRYPFMGVGDEFLREARIAPDKVNSRLSYMVYEDKVMVISSRHESYGFILQSRDMAEMLVDQFMLIWNIAKPASYPKGDGQSFLDLLDEPIEAWE